MVIRQRMCIPVPNKVLSHFLNFFPLLFSGFWTSPYPKLRSLPILPGNLNSNRKLSSLKSLGKPPGLQQVSSAHYLLVVDHLEF